MTKQRNRKGIRMNNKLLFQLQNQFNNESISFCYSQFVNKFFYSSFDHIILKFRLLSENLQHKLAITHMLVICQYKRYRPISIKTDSTIFSHLDSIYITKFWTIYSVKKKKNLWTHLKKKCYLVNTFSYIHSWIFGQQIYRFSFLLCIKGLFAVFTF